MNAGVYEVNGRGSGSPLYVELPDEVLPPGAEREIEEETPGYFHEYPRWVKLQTGKISKDGRIPVFLYKPDMERIDIDINKMPSIKIQGLPYIYFDAHLIYRWEALPFYGRLWIPRRVAIAMNIRPESTILAKIRGYSYPRYRRITVVDRYVEVTHMERTYPAEIQGNKWRWTIPENIEGYEVLTTAIKKNIMPIAECNNIHGRVHIDFTFRRPAATILAETLGYAYRNMAVRNYSATDLVDYPIICDVRCTYITMMPKEYYDNEEERFWKLQNSLQISVKNVIAFFLGRIRSGEKKGKIQYVEGDEIHEKISIGEINSEFYYCDKYVRIKGHGQDETEYGNDILESKIPQDRVYIDRNGFVWRNEEEE